jgi:beta-N-acetylhexosaminidase
MKVTQVCLIGLMALIACKSNPPAATVSRPTAPSTVPAPASAPPVVKQAPSQPKVLALSPDDSLDLKIGQMIMLGINERTALPKADSFRQEMKNYWLGGILLFEKNIAKTSSGETLRQLITDLQQAAPLPLLVGIDEEGGRVHRLKEKYGFVRFPSAAYLGAMTTTDSTTYYTRRLAALLSELGFNLNFAPTVDLAVNPNNPVIVKAERSYSKDSLRLVKHASAAIDAHDAYGIITVLKHFPGHGSSATDSHLGITNVTRQWQRQELFPYKSLIKSGKARAILTSHVINCRLDTTCLPASLSKAMNTGLLRNQLGFDGVIFTDDMQMHAISKQYGLEKAIKLSVLSGVDVLVYGNTGSPAERVTAARLHNILKNAVKSGEIPESRIDESYRRITKLKRTIVK